MRSRSNSGVRLDYYHLIVSKTIIVHQNPVTGLLPATSENDHSWVRDNVYGILAVWGLSMAYKKNADLDEDRAKTYELEQCCVKLMRGLLVAMMHQRDKVERFKETLAPKDSLHAKYSSANSGTVVGDDEWGHLQIDATSLYLLILAQMTASGLQIIFNLDEVAFVQNLIFYIESAYCIPDYGIWERGDKTNHGLPELNASSIGMAKAALEAMNELDLFGARGGPSSVIHVLADEAQKCRAVLQSMLPRESNSKELDAALLSVIGFPAFAVEDSDLIKLTRDTIRNKLQGRYGCKRFLRDGYQTAKEDQNRLYYDPWELKMFENIECEWPLFFCYMILDGCFRNDKEMIAEYQEALDEILVKTEEGFKLVPEMYTVPEDKVNLEYINPHSQERVAIGKLPFKWAQSLYILGKLLQDGFLAPGELDPLNRRLCSEKKPDVVVQVVVIAHDMHVKAKLLEHDFDVQTVEEVAPIEVQSARVLSNIYTYLGRNKKLLLSGRMSRDVGILSTSKLYSLQDRIFVFTPQFVDRRRFYIASDIDVVIDMFKTEISFLKSSWQMLGRPCVVIPITHAFLEESKLVPAMISTMKKLKSGYINGTRVNLGKLEDFLSTSCISDLSFLGNQEDGSPDVLNNSIREYLEKELNKPLLQRLSSRSPHLLAEVHVPPAITTSKTMRRKSSVAGMIRRSRTIHVGDDEMPLYVTSRRHSPSNLPKITDSSPPGYTSPEFRTRSPSPDGADTEVEDWVPAKRYDLSSVYAGVDIVELLSILQDTDNLDEQGDILQYLVMSRGLHWDTGFGSESSPATVKNLLKALYEKAGQKKKWALVRHIAGTLGKRVQDLNKAVTDMLVRQKQITVGIPPYSERTITRPLPFNELRYLIHGAYGEDESTAMLTQELIVYLAMFIRTEPQLFHEMLRLRVGLIIQVMASELAHSLKCSGGDASEHLLNLSPFEMKNLLHHIMSGKEFGVQSARSGLLSVVSCRSGKVSKVSYSP